MEASTTLTPDTAEVTNSAPPVAASPPTDKPAKAKKAGGKKKEGKAKSNGKPHKAKGKKDRKPRIRKEGLLNIQARALVVLNKTKGSSLSYHEIASRSGITTGIMVQYVGHLDKASRTNHEEKYLKHPTLITMKYVKPVDGPPKKLSNGTFSDTPGPTEFKITALGRRMIESEEGKAIIKKLKPRKPLAKE